LLSYGPDFMDIFRRSASYVDRILRGAKPEDLPVQLPTKFVMTLNAKTAKALGLTIPERLLTWMRGSPRWKRQRSLGMAPSSPPKLPFLRSTKYAKIMNGGW
jgi:ABC-type uncharacterized transport system substrate-binding protein